nr:unnamed protein product [Digitaria exilis]
MVDDLGDLGGPITDCTLVLNEVRPSVASFVVVCDDMILDELHLADTPAFCNALLTRTSTHSSQRPPTAPVLGRQGQPGGSGTDTSKSSTGDRANRRSNKGSSKSSSKSSGGSLPPIGGGRQQSSGSSVLSYYNPWTVTNNMWPGSPDQQALLVHQMEFQVQQGIPAPCLYPYFPPPGFQQHMTGMPSSWDQQSLAPTFNTMTLQQPPQTDLYFDSDATSHMTSPKSGHHLSHPGAPARRPHSPGLAVSPTNRQACGYPDDCTCCCCFFDVACSHCCPSGGSSSEGTCVFAELSHASPARLRSRYARRALHVSIQALAQALAPVPRGVVLVPLVPSLYTTSALSPLSQSYRGGLANPY